MRKHIPNIILGLLLVWPAAALAVDSIAVSGTADCTGWNTDVEITFRPGADMVRLSYVVALNGPNGNELERYEFDEWLDVPAAAVAVFSYSGSWSTELADGAYDMACDVLVLDLVPDAENRFEGDFTAVIECGDTPTVTKICPRGAWFWRSHPADWPVTSLELGADYLDQTALLDILFRYSRGDMTVLLAKALISAKLNLAGGAGHSHNILDVIPEANAYLITHPVGSRPRRTGRRSAISLVMSLVRYNHRRCEDPNGEEDDSFNAGTAKPGTGDYDKAAAIEVMSLGTLKALYR